jgi:hypothetical protein
MHYFLIHRTPKKIHVRYLSSEEIWLSKYIGWVVGHGGWDSGVVCRLGDVKRERNGTVPAHRHGDVSRATHKHWRLLVCKSQIEYMYMVMDTCTML